MEVIWIGILDPEFRLDLPWWRSTPVAVVIVIVIIINEKWVNVTRMTVISVSLTGTYSTMIGSTSRSVLVHTVRSWLGTLCHLCFHTAYSQCYAFHACHACSRGALLVMEAATTEAATDSVTSFWGVIFYSTWGNYWCHPFCNPCMHNTHGNRMSLLSVYHPTTGHQLRTFICQAKTFLFGINWPRRSMTVCLFAP